MKIVLLPQAQEDLDRVLEPLFSRLIRQISALKEYPELGASMAGPFAGYRGFIVEFYRVVYRVSGQHIEIAYIRDCRRRPLS
ncbi:MAG: type II toxin-antitoxin system RelE/ParE family toxin [Elusimicrobia bacterium]|nr:type II toxin-antitoxin system RelE/ParE family toxin [Elusimicrobiota bacterium]